MILGLGIGILVYAAFVFDLFGFLARDELWLRLLMLAASALYLVYYYYVAEAPLWDALITNGALAAVNLLMICVVVMERTTFGLSAEDTELYHQFPLLTPGQFRALLKVADRIDGTADQALSSRNQPLDRLYFISEGDVLVDKGGEVFTLAAPAFVGEIAFITGDPATASVRTTAGTRGLAWHQATLDALFARKPALRVAMAAHLNTDLARKVARSQPVLVPDLAT